LNRSPATIVIAGTASGVGKTSVTLGLARAFKRRGLRVQPLKVGPDYLDPTHLTMAAGTQCYNVDSWMTSPDYVRALVAKLGQQSDLCLIEGVMGLYDGATPDGLAGSTAEISMLLDAPVLLVCNAHGAARSLAAMVKGYSEFEPGIHVAGVLANRVGSERHVRWLRTCLQSAGQPPLIGAIERDAFPHIQSRHLGLVSADQKTTDDGVFEELADVMERQIDLDSLLDTAAEAAPLKSSRTLSISPVAHTRIGVARDEAFHFYYPDNLEMLRDAGAEVVFFSPLFDKALPPDLDGLIIGGGYPEEFGPSLAANTSLRCAIGGFAAKGNPIYGECGGLMYLGQELTDRAGHSHAMCGALPLSTRMLPKRKALGYVEATLAYGCCLGPAGTRMRGHEFHYSEVSQADRGQLAPFLSGKRSAGQAAPCGFAQSNVIASYIHVHFASCPEVPEHFVRTCVESQ